MASLPPQNGAAANGGNDDEPPKKKLKTHTESAEQYSDAVRHKMAQTARTGQACDRCKERKMKCDKDPECCGPCRQKGLDCLSTDRVTGQSRRRGDEGEMRRLREELDQYRARYGPLNAHASPRKYTVDVPPRPQGARQNDTKRSPRTGPLRKGPMNMTVVDLADGETIDVADFDCESMREPAPDEILFNASGTSIKNTIIGFQEIGRFALPSKEAALENTNFIMEIMVQYFPVVHRPSFQALVARLFDKPDTISMAERVQVYMVLAIFHQQVAVRNEEKAAENYEKSHQFLHYALGQWRHLYVDETLEAMQALALIILYMRNLPKPGIGWKLGKQVLFRATDLQYHRNPDEIELPKHEQNALAKELRMRIYNALLVFCMSTVCRFGQPADWQASAWQLPIDLEVVLPVETLDGEISVDGLAAVRSGQCDFHPARHLTMQVPLLLELYNRILAVRLPAQEYLEAVNSLNGKIEAWRRDWDKAMERQGEKHINLDVASLLMEQWTAELGQGFTEHFQEMCKELNAWDRVWQAADKGLKSGKHLRDNLSPRAQRLETEHRQVMARFSNPTTETFASVNGTPQTSHRASLPGVQQEPTPSPQSVQHGQIAGRPASMPSTYNTVPSAIPTPMVMTPPQSNGSAYALPYTPASAGQNYTAYPQQASIPAPGHTQAMTQQHLQPSFPQQIPTSMATILNGPQASYQGYDTALAAPTTTTDGTMIDFVPLMPEQYYFHPDGTMAWPQISMPPRTQPAQQLR
ncbi:uncharacterized protein AB675_9518 [Cyphellophora attinorum]|uniref:Zn(2)-C6 fungal-type domain-containing protein n=1 Tax=Cyphellophora attinorum TaxID=1664694 RepID=A0A0N0NP49_9EURO|nr:uncharacterized protein AB675_9518 [Phialophora attinorum]KPI42308.1 hypothetical protein AB675_9518 [Phialophora attinorum]